MRVHTLGSGDPAFAVVACLHGDELCGKRAIERFLDAEIPVEKPVKFVIANEEAIETGERFIDEDLNRAFPGHENSTSHEDALAAKVLAELEGLRVLDLHSTVSYPEPFVFYHRLTETTRHMLRATGLEKVVNISHVGGGLINHVDGIAVECGLKGSDEATENASELLVNYLAANGIIDHEYALSDPDVYRVTTVVPGAGYEFLGENFVEVKAGEVFATKLGEPEKVADEAFYPVLMSTDGYDHLIGFAAEKLGRLSTVPNEDDF
ncbi:MULTISPECIES: succinylglutamate desuccinylase/aspartoacylase family protein [unclassified Haladaptatus]|uniref:succinylglutamate desuccinylase/aspartoacylase domain-containing protein n=1 Tax=unclassified Haladaptatus TaxID=2622732 RepID=UPI0023E777A8|nr:MULTISPECIES: succinylglutamate desuccinylase/aspartoacylase family protein [unclassified Haladaptatus]